MKAHPFFKSLKFALLRHMTPPIVPGLTNSSPYRGKESSSLDLDRDEPVAISSSGVHVQDPFHKFNSGKYLTYTQINVRTN